MGGIETYLLKLYTHINKKDFHFDFIDTNTGEPCFYNEFKSMGCNFYKITPRNKSILKNKRELKALFANNNFDILHCHLNTLSYIQPILAALQSDCKVIVHSRNAGKSNSFLTDILHRFNSYRLPKSKIKMLAVSDFAGNWLFGKNSDVTVINNGIDINRFKFNELQRQKLRNQLGLNNNFVIGHIGAFLNAKNHKFLIQIFKNLVKLKPNARLILVGKGELEHQINEMIVREGLHNKVLMLGKREDIPALLSVMDVFVFPSFFEGFPNVLLEAQTSGLSCIVSDIITKEVEILSNYKRLSLNTSAQRWAEQIINLEITSNRESMAVKIKTAGFSVGDEIRKIENIYYSLID